jgi:hypothetical protein
MNIAILNILIEINLLYHNCFCLASFLVDDNCSCELANKLAWLIVVDYPGYLYKLSINRLIGD